MAQERTKRQANHSGPQKEAKLTKLLRSSKFPWTMPYDPVQDGPRAPERERRRDNYEYN